jgi:tRNA pseudouridine55 synthase
MAGWCAVGRGGLVVVDKPGGMTSHDVVSRVRRLAGTRRVGHAGTLDPMATGVLVIGVDRGTRLLTYVVGAKRYRATIRLGAATVTDDAEGEVLSTADARSVDDAAIRAGLAALTGEIDQVPSAVSAVKVAGRRAYARVRAGEQVALASRRVTVARLDLLAVRRTGGFVDLEVDVVCSPGTYVRAIARDLGVALGVGGHLTALRRTAVGPFTVAEAHTLEDLAASGDPVTLPLPAAAARLLPRRDASADEARVLAHGGPLPAVGVDRPYAVFGPDGEVIAVVSERAGAARPDVVFAPAGEG